MFFKNNTISSVRFLWAFLLLFFCLNNFAQQPYIKKLSFIDGLPTQNIYNLYLSKKGLLYLATDLGLVEYDGIVFKQIPMKNQMSNAVDAISEDNEGNIWCKNFSNQIFKITDDTLDIFPTEFIDDNDNLIDYHLKGDNVWILTQNNFYKVDINGEVEKIAQKDPFESFNYFQNLKLNPRGEFVINDNKYFYNFSENGEFLKKEEILKLSPFNFLQFDYLRNEKYIFFNRTMSFNKVGYTNKSIEVDKDFTTTYINHINKIDNNMWLCTNMGLFLLDTINNKINLFALENIRVSSLAADNEGGKWIASPDQGLFYLPSQNIKELLISKYSNNSLEIGEDNTFFIGNGNGEIFHFSFENELLNVYDFGINKEIVFLKYDSNQKKLFSNIGVIDLINNSFIAIDLGKCLEKDDQGNFLLATSSIGGLINQNFSSSPNVQFEIDHIKTTYSPLNIPLIYFRNKRARTTKYSIPFQKYYYGFIDGLYVYDKKGNENQIRIKDEKPIIATQIINDLEDSTIIWVASMQNGVIQIEDDVIKQQITLKDGLSSNYCKRILDIGNELIIVTEKGLDIFNKSTKQIVSITNNYFIRGININDILLLNNQLLIATSENILIHQSDFSSNNQKIKIEDLKAFVEGVQIAPNSELNKDQNSLKFQFQAVSFKSMGDFQYQYRLLGYNEQWINQSAFNNAANFISLPSGSYIFQLRVVMNNKIYDEKEFRFVIMETFWESLWAVVVLILFIFNIIIITSRATRHFVNKRQLIKQQILQSQLTALRAQMNPHFMFNILSSVQGLIFSNRKTEASEYLGKFSNLMRKNLEISDQQTISLSEEVKMIANYLELEALRFNENEFEYDINFEENELYKSSEIPSMIIQPFVENAIKHGLLHKQGEKKLTLNIEYLPKNKNIIIEIIDNGVGRKASAIINQKRKNHQSFSSKAIESRVDLINKIRKKPISLFIEDLKSDNDEALGTKVTLNIPIDE